MDNDDISDCVILSHMKHDHHEKGKNHVIVTLYVRNAIDVNITFDNDGFEACFGTRDASFLKKHAKDASEVAHFVFNIRTKDAIVESECHFKVKAYNVEITLKKVVPVRWGSLHKIVIPNELKSKSEATLNNTPHNLLLGGKSTPLTKKSTDENKQEVETEHAPGPSKSQDKRNIHKTVGAALPVDNLAGLIGLENYANNCYMNVVVQVLSNLLEVREYFKNDHYMKDINANNTLGSGGKVAKAFSDVVKALWTPVRRVFKPHALKNIMGRQCSLFLGWQQHDAQEFFASLLDNLHEDINQPQAIENVADAAGKCVKSDCDTTSANEKPDTAWFSHQKRNNSFIVKLFHGQLMSKLTCSACHKLSYSFDPCAQISLPIPANKQHHKILFFSRDISEPPVLMNIQVSTVNALLWHLLNIIHSIVKVPPHLISTFKGVHEVVESDQLPVSSVKKFKYLICCEVASKEELETISLPVFQYALHAKDFLSCDHCYKSPKDLGAKMKRCTRCFSVGYCSRECQMKHWSLTHSKTCNKDLKRSVGVPFYITVTKEALNYKFLEESLREYSKHSVECIHSQTTDNNNSSKTENENIQGSKLKSCPFIIKSSAKINCNDDASETISAENLTFDLLNKSTCLIMEWQNSSSDEQIEGDIRSKEEPDHVMTTVDSSPLLASSESTEQCSLADCLKLFMEPERLDEKESWKCPKCKTPQAAKKEMALSSPPCLLLLHLKRFTYGEYGQKINKAVSYPLSDFDLSPYIAKETRSKFDQPLLYDLTGVITHRGTMRMGHYTCMARLLNQLDQEELGWRQFNDDSVMKIRPEKVVSPDAYVLIYRIHNLNDVIKLDRTPSFQTSHASFQDSGVVKRKKADNVNGTHSSKSTDRRSFSENSINRFKRSMSTESSDEIISDKKKTVESKKPGTELFRSSSAIPILNTTTQTLKDHSSSTPDLLEKQTITTSSNYQRESSTSSEEYVDCTQDNIDSEDKKTDELHQNIIDSAAEDLDGLSLRRDKLESQLSRESLYSINSFTSVDNFLNLDENLSDVEKKISDVDENDLD